MGLLEQLKANNYAIIASNGYCSSDNGIKPVISKINESINFFEGLDVADKIVGKASAMLLCMSKVNKVYCLVLSESGKSIFDLYGVEYEYEKLVPYIINRDGNDMCPMEKTVKDIDDFKQALVALNNKLSSLKAK